MCFRKLFLLIVLLLPLPVTAVTLKIATVAPDGTAWMNAFRQKADEIKKRTDGRVEFRFYPGGIMGNDKSVLRKIRVGQLHGGAITGGGLAEIYPDAQIYSLPFVFNSFAEVDYVRSRMDAAIMQGLEKEGFIGFGISEGGFAYLMSAHPVAKLEELKSRKVWVPEGDIISHTAFQAVGVHPVSLPLTDVLTGLQTGLVDTVAASAMGAIALQWHTRLKYLTEVPLIYLYGSLVISTKAFARLQPEDQAVIREVFGEMMQQMNVQNRRDDEQAMAVLQQQGLQFIAFDDGDGWHEAVGQTTRQLTEKRVFSDAMLKILQDNLAEYRSMNMSESPAKP
ncbi:MAG: TRAP transporter substrate-binding protein DctP [Thiohalomonadaceae bacterium]